jgi:hypothetical protein
LAWVICTATYFSFTWFLLNLFRWIETTHGRVFGGRAGFAVMVLFAYSVVFAGNIEHDLWGGLADTMAEGLVYLAAGLCIRLSLPYKGPRFIYHAALGVVLALTYLTKAAFFPLSCVLLAILFVRPLSQVEGRGGVVVAGVAFLVVASPLVVFLSHAKGHPTFGEAGGLAYARYVNEVPVWSILWQDHLPGGGMLLHPARKLSSNPPIVKFEHFQSAWPLWYDASYWWDGLKPHFDMREQVTRFLRSLALLPMTDEGYNVGYLVDRCIPMLAALAAFLALGLRPRNTLAALGKHGWLLWWPAVAFLTFASTAIQFRYLIPFWVMGWIALFLAAWIVIKPRRSVGITLAVAVGILLTNSRPFARELLQITRAPADDSVAAARKLESLGIRQGDEVATVGFPDWPYDYARIAGIQFALELFGGGPGAKDVAPLSKLPAADVSRILATLRANGAKALFATGRPAFENDTGWVHLTCDTYVRML